MNKALNGAQIKSPNKQEIYTEYELEEISKCADPDTGFMYFAENYSYIQHPIHGKVKFSPYEYQKRVLQAFNDHRYIISLQPRQSGKCSTYDTIISYNNKPIKIGSIIQNKLTFREKLITLLERWLVQLTKND